VASCRADETAQGVRYTISEPARREVLARLLALNHQRYEEEQQRMKAEGGTLRVKGKGKRQEAGSKKGKGKKAGKEQLGLF
jgi:predicted secreted protein